MADRALGQLQAIVGHQDLLQPVALLADAVLRILLQELVDRINVLSITCPLLLFLPSFGRDLALKELDGPLDILLVADHLDSELPEGLTDELAQELVLRPGIFGVVEYEDDDVLRFALPLLRGNDIHELPEGHTDVLVVGIGGTMERSHSLPDDGFRFHIAVRDRIDLVLAGEKAQTGVADLQAVVGDSLLVTERKGSNLPVPLKDLACFLLCRNNNHGTILLIC